MVRSFRVLFSLQLRVYIHKISDFLLSLAQIWTASFLNKELDDDFVAIRKDLLDDSNAAKDEMDKAYKAFP